MFLLHKLSAKRYWFHHVGMFGLECCWMINCVCQLISLSPGQSCALNITQSGGRLRPLKGRRCECLLSDPHPAPGQWQCHDHHNVSIVHLELHNRLGNFKKIFPCPLFKQKVKSSFNELQYQTYFKDDFKFFWLDLRLFPTNKLEVYIRYLFPTHKSRSTDQWHYCHLIYCKQIPALSQLTS